MFLVWSIWVLVTYVYGQDDLSPLLAGDRLLTGPGVRARLNPAGIQYVVNMVSNALIDESVSTHFSPLQPFRLSNSSMTVSSLEVLALRMLAAPRTAASAPNHIRTHAPSILATVGSLTEGELAGGHTKTPMIMNATEMPVVVDISVSRDTKGIPVLKIINCDIPSGFPMVVSYNKSLPSASRHHLVSLASHDAVSIFRRTLCPRFINLVENRINSRFTMLPSKVSLTGDFDIAKIIADEEDRRARLRRFGSRRPKRQNRISQLFKHFDLTRAGNLFLDYSLTLPPVASPNGLEIFSSGEIALLNAKTPFGPRPVPSFTTSTGMLQMALSDYVPNTLMYHGHKLGLFNTRVDPSTPQFGSMMRSSCDLSSGALFCVGDLFPTLRQALPNRGIAFLFSTIRAPVLIVRPEHEGGIFFALTGLMRVNVLEGVEREAGRMVLDISGTMKMKLNSKVVKGKIALDQIRLTTLSPDILSQSELDDAGFLSHEIIQRIVNDVLKDGIPIPVHPLFKLKSPKMTLVDRAVLISTNFELNEKLVRQLTATDVRRKQ